MNGLSPNFQRLLWVILAIACILLATVPRFSSVSALLEHIASLVIGGVLVSKPGDAPAPLVDIVQKVAASLNPPAPPPPDSN